MVRRKTSMRTTMAKKPMTSEEKLLAISLKRKRWQTRARRAHTAIDKLMKQERYWERKISSAPAILVLNAPKDQTPIQSPDVAQEAKPTTPADLSIPQFLQRRPLSPEAAEIATEIAEKKKAKARGRIEKMKAKKSGATKAMPLSGKAALDLINSGK